MRDVILVGDETFTLDRIKAVSHTGSIVIYENLRENEYQVKYGYKDYVIYIHDNSAVANYEKKELKKIPYSAPNFIFMSFHNIERFKDIINQKDFPKDIYIDNDNFLILPIDQYIKKGMPL